MANGEPRSGPRIVPSSSRGDARTALGDWVKAEGLWSFGLPLLLFYGARGRLGAGGALVLASLSPLLALAAGLLRERRVKPFALVVAASSLAGAALAWAFQDARAIVYKDATVDALFGVAFCALGLLRALPLHRLFAPVAPLLHPRAGQGAWDSARVRATFRRLTFLWSAQSFVFAASKPLCLFWFGLDGYVPSSMAVRGAVQTVVVLWSLWRLRRAMGAV